MPISIGPLVVASAGQLLTRHQVQLLRGGMSGLGSVRGGFSSMGDVVTLIQKKRSRDCYILTFFISFLLCFLLYWGWMR